MYVGGIIAVAPRRQQMVNASLLAPHLELASFRTNNLQALSVLSAAREWLYFACQMGH
jgi:hypothetical protein